MERNDRSSLTSKWINKIDSHTVALVHYREGQRQPERVDSGVLVSVNGFPYLATAGHCLEPKGETIRVAYGQKNTDPDLDWSHLVGSGVYNAKTFRSSMDAAFVPIREPQRLTEHGKSFYKVPKNFPARFVLEKGAEVFVLGYPDELWEPLTEISSGSLEIGSLVYRTTIVTTTEHSYEYTYDPRTVVEWSHPDVELPSDPGGLSGSGLWLIPRSEAESLRLLGINIAHSESSRKCVAMFVEAWMAFFSLALEEDRVKSILDEAFKNVAPAF